MLRANQLLPTGSGVPADWRSPQRLEMPAGVTGGVDMIYSYKPPEIQVKDPEFWKGKLKIDIGKMINKKSLDQSLTEWFENYDKEPGGQMLTKISQEIVTINGRNAVRVVSELKTGEGKNISYYIENNDFVYFISAGGDFNSQNQNIFDQILSTFKFIDQNSTTDTTNWKTYISSKFSFSVKYPEKVAKFPENWVYEEIKGDSSFAGGVGFGTPASKSGGYIWGIYVYGGKDKEEIISQIGKQFKDRRETRQEIIVNNLPATLVTVTTNEIKDWVSKTVIVGRFRGEEVTTYVISNGAVILPEFDAFYESFRID